MTARLEALDRHGRALPRRRHRHLQLSPARAEDGGQGQAPHRPRRHRPRRRADPRRRALRHARSRWRWPRAGWPRSRLRPTPPAPSSRARRAPSRSTTREQFPGGAERAAPARGGARGDRAARHPQRPPHLHRADRHHLAARRQRLQRHRAGVRLPLRAPRAGARRLRAHRDGGGLRARPLPPDVRRPARR